MMIPAKRKREIHATMRRFAKLVLTRDADGAEMPDPATDEEDEYMRETLREIAEGLVPLAHSYEHDSRPPDRTVKDALAYPTIPERTLRCTCPPPRRVTAIGMFGFAPGTGHVVDKNPECPLHGDGDGR